MIVYEPKLVYLTEALVTIALKSPSGAVRGTEICVGLGLHERYLEPEFQNLVHSGVLKSIRGPKGGYILAKEKRNVSLLDIQSAIVKPKIDVKFSEMAKKVIFKKLEALDGELAKISLHDIMQDASKLGIVKPQENSDFTI